MRNIKYDPRDLQVATLCARTGIGVEYSKCPCLVRTQHGVAGNFSALLFVRATGQEAKRSLKRLCVAGGLGETPGVSPVTRMTLQASMSLSHPKCNRSTATTNSCGRVSAAQWGLQKVWVLRFFDPGPGGSGGPREVPWPIPGPSRGLRGPPGGPRDLRQTKAKNLET